jgi:hypothetical protein
MGEDHQSDPRKYGKGSGGTYGDAPMRGEADRTDRDKLAAGYYRRKRRNSAKGRRVEEGQ